MKYCCCFFLFEFTNIVKLKYLLETLGRNAKVGLFQQDGGVLITTKYLTFIFWCCIPDRILLQKQTVFYSNQALYGL